MSELPSWKHVFRNGFAPILPRKGLESLRDALRNDDKRLLQGATSSPPPLLCVADWPCEGACAIGFAAWQGLDLSTVGEVNDQFARACFESDQRLGEPASCRYLLNWFDDTPREEMREELLAEVELALAAKEEK